MRIASFDIGKVNFAFSVIDFMGAAFSPVALEHANLDNYVFLCHQCKCRAALLSLETLRGTCRAHMDPRHRHVKCQPYSPTYNMFNYLDRFINLLRGCDLVLIERQPGKSRWQEELCRGIEFYMYLRRVPVDVRYFRTVSKLGYLPPISEKNKSRRYEIIKTETSIVCRGWLEEQDSEVCENTLEYLDMMGTIIPGRAIDVIDSIFNAVVFYRTNKGKEMREG